MTYWDKTIHANGMTDDTHNYAFVTEGNICCVIYAWFTLDFDWMFSHFIHSYSVSEIDWKSSVKMLSY